MENVSDEQKQFLAINKCVASTKNLQEAINMMKKEHKDGIIKYDFISLDKRINDIVASIIQIIDNQRKREEEQLQHQEQQQLEQLINEKKKKLKKKAALHKQQDSDED
jgi:subtilase family serine protease